MKSILFVCLGNICRSPMAEFICKNLLKEKKLENEFIVESAGLHSFHEGENMHKGTQLVLNKHKIEFFGFKSKPITKDMFNSFDYIFVMDNDNYRDITSRFGINNKVQKICKFSSIGYDEVPDP